ncbi:30S ribosomal protein S11 [Patescibacteria group bacterium]|nr:30S ribosomal protein S11 [Patescibacteria group bacterium]
MGKKRIIKTEDTEGDIHGEPVVRVAESASRPEGARKGTKGIAHIQATYNNTAVSLTDEKGNMLVWSSAGAMGFKGAKKATPFAASRVAETVVEKAKKMGLDEVIVLVKGVGSGRESAIRSLANHGLNITLIKDITPMPHNGPRPKKVRRV